MAVQEAGGSEEALNSLHTLVLQATELKGQIAVVLANVEEANRKANSESGYAFNAKQNAEDHAKAVAQIRGTVESDLTWLTAAKKEMQDAAQATGAVKLAADNELRIISQAKTTSNTEVVAIQAAKEKAAALLVTIEQSKATSEASSKKSTSDEAAIAKAKAAAESNAALTQELQARTQEAATNSQVNVGAIAASETESKKLIGSISKIVDGAKTTSEKVEQYEKDLSRLTADFINVHGRIEELLPGATSAALASAYGQQKERFKYPQRYWLGTFIAAIVLLLVSSLIGWPTETQQEHWDFIWRHLVVRLPLVAPLIWLAIYAGRNYMLSLRVQEEYAFKEAVSRTFEGYKREMAAIPGNGNGVQPLITLCENVLLTISQRPGRIYEGHQEDITMLSPVTKLVKEVLAEAMKGKKPEIPTAD